MAIYCLPECAFFPKVAHIWVRQANAIFSLQECRKCLRCGSSCTAYACPVAWTTMKGFVTEALSKSCAAPRALMAGAENTRSFNFVCCHAVNMVAAALSDCLKQVAPWHVVRRLVNRNSAWLRESCRAHSMTGAITFGAW